MGRWREPAGWLYGAPTPKPRTLLRPYWSYLPGYARAGLRLGLVATAALAWWRPVPVIVAASVSAALLGALWLIAGRPQSAAAPPPAEVEAAVPAPAPDVPDDEPPVLVRAAAPGAAPEAPPPDPGPVEATPAELAAAELELADDACPACRGLHFPWCRPDGGDAGGGTAPVPDPVGPRTESSTRKAAVA